MGKTKKKKINERDFTLLCVWKRRIKLRIMQSPVLYSFSDLYTSVELPRTVIYPENSLDLKKTGYLAFCLLPPAKKPGF